MVELDGEALRQNRVGATREAGAEQPGATIKTGTGAAPAVTLIVVLCSVTSFGARLPDRWVWCSPNAHR